jgi:116 kDa U5 small nuclear ribonucleoprotein component
MERQRGISIKSMPMSFLLADLRGKSHVINVIDTPGHVDFLDDTVAALRLCDGMVVIVDVVEGMTMSVEQVIKMAAKEGLSIVLVLNKLDRLILDLKLPPNDAYFKLKHVIEEFNACVSTHMPGSTVSPALGNVCFASSQMEWCFSLKSFAQIYARLHANYSMLDVDTFAKHLWGDVFFNATHRTFDKKNPETKTGSGKRTFVEFILEPLYKLHAYVLGESPDSLKSCLAELKIYLKKGEYELDVKPLLTLVMRRFLVDVGGFVDMLVRHVPSPVTHAKTKLEYTYKGPLLPGGDNNAAMAMMKCSSEGPLVMHISKLYPSLDGRYFDAFGRVMSGTVRPGQKVKVLGENYSLEDEEDMSLCEVNKLWIFESHYRIEVSQATAGNWILVGGIDESILKTATVVDERVDEPYTFIPLQFQLRPVVRVGVEPLNPSELPKMLEGLRKLGKSYPIFQTKVEESGEHIILGTGEMYLDCILHDLRTIYAEMEIKVADPVVTFCETVVETSSIKCSAETPNKKNTLMLIAEPLEKGLAEDIEQGRISMSGDRSQLANFLQETYQWDILQSRHVWAFGPDDNGPNVLVDDTLPSEVSKSALRNVHDSIRQGFQWAAREGPLCDEPMRNVKFRLVDATIASDPISRGSGQIIPTARRVCYSAFLTATPRIMEPVYAVEILAPANCISVIYTVLARRRGHVVQDMPRPGTPLHTVKALLPVIDSFGFETDLRIQTQGLAFCQQMFDHWQMTPGDPLDKSTILRPLEPSPASQLARDFMLKTRRRKGLGEEVALVKYFDNPTLLSLAQQDFAASNSNFL